MHRTIRLIGALLASLGLASTLACTDRVRSVSGPDNVRSAKTQPVDYSVGGTVAGQIVSTVQRLSANGTPLSVLATDSTRYEAVIRTNGTTTAELRGGEQSSAIVLAVSDKNVQRQGSWEHKSDDGKLSLRFAAVNGAPAASRDFIKDGVLLSHTETQWEKVPGGWQVASRAITLYQEGVPARLLTTVYERPVRTSTDISVGDKSGDEPAVAAFSGGPCDAEMYSEQAAIYLYWAADLGLASCLYAWLGCGKAILAFGAAVANVNAADKRLDNCVAQY